MLLHRNWFGYLESSHKWETGWYHYLPISKNGQDKHKPAGPRRCKEPRHLKAPRHFKAPHPFNALHHFNSKYSTQRILDFSCSAKWMLLHCNWFDLLDSSHKWETGWYHYLPVSKNGQDEQKVAVPCTDVRSCAILRSRTIKTRHTNVKRCPF